jgi:hypothetical protein
VLRIDPELVVAALIVRLAFNYTGHINVHPDLVPVLAGKRNAVSETIDEDRMEILYVSLHVLKKHIPQVHISKIHIPQAHVLIKYITAIRKPGERLPAYCECMPREPRHEWR